MREMKETGIKSIGIIPYFWIISRLKYEVELSGRIGYRGYTQQDLVDEGEGAITLSPSNLKDGKMNYDKCSYISWYKYNESPEIKVKNGYLLIVKTGSSYGKTSIVENLPLESTINPQLLVIKPISCNNRYLCYVMQTSILRHQIENAVVGGTIPTVAQEKINNFYFPLPNMHIQKNIVSFLDSKCSEIDSLAADIQVQIDTLEQYKRSVITEAVTKGLDKNVPMKDSGIEWVGKIPDSWRISSISYYSSSRSGGTPDRLIPSYWENGNIPWMASGEVNKVHVYETNEKITELATKNSSAKILPANCVMVALNGQGKTKGMSAILHIPAACNQSLCAFKCDEKNLHYSYLFYCFQSMYKYLRYQVGDGLRDGLAASFVKKQRIPLPNFEDQKKIANFLDKKCEEINETVSLKKEQLSVLADYKKSLIYEYVTGKKEVPNE